MSYGEESPRVTARKEDGTLVLSIFGRIDSTTVDDAANQIRQALEDHPHDAVVLDFQHLTYISSAGLRAILRLKQKEPDTRIIEASPEIYDILQTTGFTEMMDVQRTYRVLSVEGCEIIGAGANGTVYRIDPEIVVKVYLNPDALPEIKRERELARTAFISGVPTAIPYDVVRIQEGGFGSVYELLNAYSFARLLHRGEKSLEELVERSVALLKLIHSRTVAAGSMPDMRLVALDWASFLKDYLPPELADKLYSLIEAVPENLHLVHGDYHVKNVMDQNGESILIDLDTLSYGNPVFELGSMFNAYVGFGSADPTVVEKFLGITTAQAVAFWQQSLALYLGTNDPEVLRAAEEKAMIIGYARIMRRTIRRRGLETEEGRRVIADCRAHLEDLLPRIDTLLLETPND